MDTQTLKKLNDAGFLPGPEESEKTFLARIAYCKTLRNQKINDFPFPFEPKDPPKVDTPYGFHPYWVPMIYSNARLPFWQGACMWLFQMDENAPLSALIQMRCAFLSSKKYLGLYDRREILSHEYAHIGRLAYQEPKFEEFFAYATSSSFLRRFFGPIVKTERESVFFIALLFLFVLAVAGTGSSFLYRLGIGMIGTIGIFALGRLAFRHAQLWRCRKRLKRIFREKDIEAVLYRLTDKEVIEFGKLKETALRDVLEQKQKSSFRWQCILSLFPINQNH